MHNLAGLSIACCNELRSVADVLRDTVDEACARPDRLGIKAFGALRRH